jgi:hypothetical protein
MTRVRRRGAAAAAWAAARIADTRSRALAAAVENIFRYLLSCKPAGGLDMSDTARALRDACVARLAATQRKIPVRCARACCSTAPV